jgi:hypothetical protein
LLSGSWLLHHGLGRHELGVAGDSADGQHDGAEDAAGHLHDPGVLRTLLSQACIFRRHRDSLRVVDFLVVSAVFWAAADELVFVYGLGRRGRALVLVGGPVVDCRAHELLQ